MVVINVSYLIFIIVSSRKPPTNKFCRPFSMAILYSIGGLLNDMYAFESFL